MYVTLEEYDFRGEFETEKNILKLFGFYPHQETNIFNWKNVRRFISLLIIVLHFISMLLFIYFEDFDKLIEISAFFVTQVAFGYKLYLLISNGHLMSQIEGTLGNPVFYVFSKDYLKKVKRYMSSTKLFTATFRLLIALYLLVTVLTLFIQGEVRRLPLSGWLPYDVTQDKYYYATFVLEFICVSVSAYGNACIDMINYLLLTIVGCQFYILMGNLRRIDYTENAAILANELKRNIKYHLDILKLLEIINKLYAEIVFSLCIASGVVICLAGFQMIVVSRTPAEFCIILIYFCGLSMQVALYCWYGHNIMLKSRDVGEACYMTNWYESDVKIRKILFIIMERSKRPVELKGGFITMSLPVLMKILKSSYSYFALLQHMYGK